MQIIVDGIPQGSTLSTTFFLLYINDIINATTSKVYTYADDTTLIITMKHTDALQLEAQTELTKLINYFHTNNLVPNPTKTTFTVFCPKDFEAQLRVSNVMLEQTKDAKLLGLMLQNDLKYNLTVANIIKKLQQIKHSFRYANKLLPTETMLQLYNSFIYPNFISNITIWGTDDTSKTYIMPLVTFQKSIVRLIKNVPPRAHTKPIMTELKILNIYNLYTLRVCLEVHSHLHPKAVLNRPSHDHKYTRTSSVHHHRTRQSERNHLYVQNAENYPKPNLTTTYTNVYNKVPPELQTIVSHRLFKQALKQYLQSKQ